MTRSVGFCRCQGYAAASAGPKWTSSNQISTKTPKKIDIKWKC